MKHDHSVSQSECPAFQQIESAVHETFREIGRKVNLFAFVALAICIAGMVGLYAWEARAATQATNIAEERGISGQIITTTTDPQFLTVPTGATHVRLYVEGQPVCYAMRSDAEPNPAGGGKFPAGYVSKEENDRLLLQATSFVTCTGATPATIHAYYTRRRFSNERATP